MTEEIVFEDKSQRSNALLDDSEATSSTTQSVISRGALPEIAPEDEIVSENVDGLRNLLGQTFFNKVEEPDIVLGMMMTREENTEILYQIDAFRKLTKYKAEIKREEINEKNRMLVSLRSKKVNILEAFIFEIKQAEGIADMVNIIDSFLQSNGELYGFRSDSILIQYLYPRSKTEKLLVQLKKEIDLLIALKKVPKGVYINDYYSLPELSAFKNLFDYQEKLHKLSKSNWVNGTVRKVAAEKYSQLNRLTSRLALQKTAEEGRKVLTKTVQEQPVLRAHSKLPYALSGFSSTPKSVSLIKELKKSLVKISRAEQRRGQKVRPR